MPRFFAPLLIILLLAAANLSDTLPAGAVVQGSASSLGQYTVRLIGSGNCTGVVIARQAVVTAAHCAHGMHVLTGGGSARVVGVARSAVLDDGRRVSVSGAAAILKLSEALSGVSAAPVGDGGGDSFVIAGYGTMDERERGAFGELHEASLVAASGRALVDPRRSGSIGACFGDSGGPVMSGGMLVGIITRAAHPSPGIACGDLTRWAPITASGSAQAVAVADQGTTVAEPRSHRRQRHARRTQGSAMGSANLFNDGFAPKVETRRVSLHKAAQR
jgi:hypothetical protein